MELRKEVGKDYPLMIDCYMALDVPYAIDLANALKEVDIYWIEEVLPPHDLESHKYIKKACPWQRWTTGEHTNTRYGFKKLLEDKSVDIIQPDVTLCGLSEVIKIMNMASTYDVSVIPHCSGVYAYNFGIVSPMTPINEFINLSPNGDKIVPVFGKIFTDEPIPKDGYISLSDKSGFGVTLNNEVELEEVVFD
jgi:L-rhamnonate dehydratase